MIEWFLLYLYYQKYKPLDSRGKKPGTQTWHKLAAVRGASHAWELKGNVFPLGGRCLVFVSKTTVIKTAEA